MRHHLFVENDTYPIALLMKPSAFNKQELQTNYVDPCGQFGVAPYNIIAFTLALADNGKVTAKAAKDYLAELLPALQSIGSHILYVTDSTYFKVLTGVAKAEPHYGYCLPCKHKGYEHMKVVLGINYQTLIYNPELKAKQLNTIKTAADCLLGTYTPPGQTIIHSAHYPKTVSDIEAALKSLHQYPSLTCDIEAFSLKFWEAGIGTIAFAWDEHNGIAFACDYTTAPVNPCKIVDTTSANLLHGVYEANGAVRALLREFFETYQGELTFHNSGYDLKPIIANLWMTNLLDTKWMLQGLDTMTRALNDTKIIAYLATNSTAGNSLGLKALAHEFAGNWAKDDIKDIRLIPLDDLLQYNLVDALATHYVRKKYELVMIQDNQQKLYQELMMPSQKLITQMEMTGMPMSRKRIQEVKAELEQIQASHLDTIQNSKLIQVMDLLVQTKAMQDANAKLKTKQHPLEKFADKRFNPNSGPQLQVLLYEQMGLPVIDYTDTKQPATGAETIEKLINHTQEPEYRALLSALIEYGKVTKILSTFIPAFEGAISKDNSDIVWLHGNFNLGGTVSGRLSSSDPNLQNLPAGSKYGKLIKSCFMGPEGHLFCGADFNSLEDYISALTTKDPNKLQVYLRGFDGHCLRAAYYFRDQVPHIDLDDPKSVNTLKKTHPELRQESKSPTFLLTYGGTYHGMMSNLGWSEEKSKAIEANYHELYKVSDEYVQKRLEQAAKDGYVEVAFGLRVRTPLLKQVVFKGYKMPFEAAAEGRTAGNALGQSYGLLNNRAAVAFWQKVWASPYRYDIRPVALIHDAIYPLIKNDVDVVTWANKELIDAMRWQELPEIQHPTVKLGAALDIFWPDWAHPTTLPNDADKDAIVKVCEEAKAKMLEDSK